MRISDMGGVAVGRAGFPHHFKGSAESTSALQPFSHAAQGCFRRCRSVDAGYFASIAGGRIGRLAKLPWQLGQTPPNTVAAQSAQNVHSKVQIRAAGLSGGRSRSQHSQFGFTFIMTGRFLSS
jgi:hypothetical protein